MEITEVGKATANAGLGGSTYFFLMDEIFGVCAKFKKTLQDGLILF